MRVSRLMTKGRTMLSIQLTTIVPQISRPTPAAVWPVAMSQKPIEPHNSGTTNGSSPQTVVSTARNTGAPTPAAQ